MSKEKGTANDPIIIIPGNIYIFSKKSVQINKNKNVKANTVKTLEKNHGLGHDVEMSASSGVVVFVPEINNNSPSSFECDLNTSEKTSFKLTSTAPFSPII